MWNNFGDDYFDLYFKVFAVFIGDRNGNFYLCQIVNGNGEILETLNPQVSDVEEALARHRLSGTNSSYDELFQDDW